MLSSVGGAPCASHPSAAAEAPCARCGVFLCAGCVRPRKEAKLCPACFQRAKRAETSRAVVALVLAYCGLQFCFPFLGIVGLYLGYDERRRIATGESTEESEGYARWAIILGWVNVAVLALLVLLGVVGFAAWRATEQARGA